MKQKRNIKEEKRIKKQKRKFSELSRHVFFFFFFCFLLRNKVKWMYFKNSLLEHFMCPLVWFEHLDKYKVKQDSWHLLFLL